MTGIEVVISEQPSNKRLMGADIECSIDGKQVVTVDPGSKWGINTNGSYRSLVATQDIKRGDTILWDSPIAWCTPDQALKFRGSNLWALTHNIMKNKEALELLMSPIYFKPGMKDSTEFGQCFKEPLWLKDDDFVAKIMALQHKDVDPKDVYGVLYVYNINFLCLYHVDTRFKKEKEESIKLRLSKGMTFDQIAAEDKVDVSVVYAMLYPTTTLISSGMGCGFYPTLSLVNHSCEWNSNFLEKANPDSHAPQAARKELVAIRNISAGEYITFSYMDQQTMEQDRETRQKELFGAYGFHCTCTKCEREKIQS
jgi:hypothetical protein